LSSLRAAACNEKNFYSLDAMKNSTDSSSFGTDESIRVLAKDLYDALSQEKVFKLTRDRYIKDLEVLNQNVPASYIKYKSLTEALEKFKKEFLQTKNTFGQLISREIVQEKKNRKEILSMQIQQTHRELEMLMVNSINEIQDYRSQLEFLTNQKNKLERKFDKYSTLLRKYRTFVYVLSIVELEINGSNEKFLIVPRKYQLSSTHEMVTPESKLGSLVLRGKIGERKSFPKNEYQSSSIVILNTNPPDISLLENLMDLIEINAKKRRDVLPMSREMNSGRWRDHGREDDQVLYCEFCGPHSLYRHNDGCEK
jgi:hypothetical protein